MAGAGAVYCDRHGEKLVDGGCPKCGPTRTREDARQRPRRGAPGTAAGRIDPRCSVSSGPLRCPAPAVWYPARAAAGRCRLHADDDRVPRDGPDLQDQLRAMLANVEGTVREMYAGEPEDRWRDQLVAGGVGRAQRRDGESRDAYHARMRDEARKLAARVLPGMRPGRGQRQASTPTPPPPPRPPQPPAPAAPGPAALDLAALDTEQVVDEIQEIAARHYADGIPEIGATRMALEQVLGRLLGQQGGNS